MMKSSVVVDKKAETIKLKLHGNAAIMQYF